MNTTYNSTLTSELQSPKLEGDKSITIFNDVYESIEPVRGEDEEVSTSHLAPPAQYQVPTQVLLQYPRKVLIKQAVQPVRVGICK